MVILLLIIALLGLFLFLKFKKDRKPEPIPLDENSEAAHDFMLAVIDVGQGSCTVIAADGKYMMIDGGTRESTKEVRQFLDDYGIQKLEYIVSTHPHADHIGSLSEIISSYEVGEVIHNGIKLDTAGCSKMFTAIEKNDVKQTVPARGDVFSLGGGSFTIISTGINDGENINNTSLCLKFEYEGTAVTVTGDAGKDVEAEILKGPYKKELKSDILIAGHHGSSDASSEAFVKKVNPREAVISCGRDNDYGHPHREVLELFEKYGITVRRTDEEGTIVYFADKGSGLKRAS